MGNFIDKSLFNVNLELINSSNKLKQYNFDIKSEDNSFNISYDMGELT